MKLQRLAIANVSLVWTLLFAHTKVLRIADFTMCMHVRSTASPEKENMALKAFARQSKI